MGCNDFIRPAALLLQLVYYLAAPRKVKITTMVKRPRKRPARPFYRSQGAMTESDKNVKPGRWRKIPRIPGVLTLEWFSLAMFQNDHKGASKRGSSHTRGTAMSFGFRRRPASGIPMPITSYANESTALHPRSKSAGPEQNRRRDDDTGSAKIGRAHV